MISKLKKIVKKTIKYNVKIPKMLWERAAAKHRTHKARCEKKAQNLREFRDALKKDETLKNKCDYVHFYDTLPVDKRIIVGEMQHGQSIGGNVFYMMKAMSHNADYESFRLVIFAVKKKLEEFRNFLNLQGMDDVELVTVGSAEYYRLLASAGYLINDTSFTPNWVKKEGQIYINTWHGTPFKAMGKNSKNDRYDIGNIQKNLIETDYLLYPNEYTAEHMLTDYMVTDIAPGQVVLAGYPRNAVFFDEASREEVRAKFGLKHKRVYAYMPTYRGSPHTKGVTKGDAYLVAYLEELDRALGEEECLYVNLHTYAKMRFDVEQMFRHIRRFPEETETYEFLNACDVLITDYSSVFYDYANSGKKVVLFPYDKEEYLKDRGTYVPMEEFPFPQVYNTADLLAELRSEKQYDDTEFLKKYCSYDNIDAAIRLCDFTVLRKENGLTLQPVPQNGKENVIIYADSLGEEAFWNRFVAWQKKTDTTKKNYYLAFLRSSVKKNLDYLQVLPPEIRTFDMIPGMNLSEKDKQMYETYLCNLISTERYGKRMQKRYEMEWLRRFGHASFEEAVLPEKAGREARLEWGGFPGKKTIL